MASTNHRRTRFGTNAGLPLCISSFAFFMESCEASGPPPCTPPPMSRDRLETRSLILEAHLAKDAEHAYRVESNAKVMQFLGGGYQDPKDEFLRDFPSQSADRFPGYIAIRRKGDHVYIGNCSLKPWRLAHHDSRGPVPAVEPRIVIDEPYWRDRYGVEVLRALVAYAFGPMGATLVAGVIDPRRPRIRQLCILYGFRRDASYSLLEPTWCDLPELWVASNADFDAARRKLVQQAENVDSGVEGVDSFW